MENIIHCPVIHDYYFYTLSIKKVMVNECYYYINYIIYVSVRKYIVCMDSYIVGFSYTYIIYVLYIHKFYDHRTLSATFTRNTIIKKVEEIELTICEIAFIYNIHIYICA